MMARALTGAFVLVLAFPWIVRSQPPQTALAELEALTTRLTREAGDALADASDLTAVARRRAELLAQVMNSAPGEVLRLAVPSQSRAALPEEARVLTEEQIELSGVVEVTYEDYRGFSRLQHVLHSGGSRYSLHFGANVPDWVTGQQVVVRGVRSQYALALDGQAAGAIAGDSAAALPNAAGQQRTLVILVNFQDNRIEPYTAATAQDVVFTQTDGYLRENSAGAAWLTGDVVGWFTIAMDSTVCDTATLATLAQTAAADAGATLANYSRFVYAFPSNACTFWGRGSVGGNPSHAWINGDIALEVAGHEIGHNLGLYHSRSMDCGASPIGISCTVDEYGDTLDLMGATRGHFNAFQKERLGWLAPSQIVTVSGSGTYALEPLAAPGNGVKALKILKSTDPANGRRTFYYLEQRRGVGYDSFMSSWTNVMTGVAVHTGSESGGNTSYLLDMTPETTSWYDPALTGGRTFTDLAAGLTLATIAAGTSGATVSVTLNPPGGPACEAAAPRVIVTPSTTAAVAPGTTVGYTVAVTNNDPAGCNSATFSLGPSVPGGWTASLNATLLQLAPGATGSTALNLTSPTTASGGTYSFQVRAADASIAVHDASASATYSVASTTPVAPGAPRSMTASVSGNTATLNWQLPSSGGAPSTYLVYVGTRSGASDVANAYDVGNVLSVRGDLQKGTYYARVRAANAVGTSVNSNEVRFTVGRRLRTPSGFTVTWTGTTAMLSWVAPAADSADEVPTSYVLEAGTAPGASNVARVNVGNTTVYRVQITSGTYYVRLRAQNAEGESDPTEDIEVRTPGAPQAATALVDYGSNATVDLRWRASAGSYPATGYLIEAGSAPGLGDLASIQVGNVTRFWTIAPPGVYYVRVRGVNARGASPPSNEIVVRR